MLDGNDLPSRSLSHSSESLGAMRLTLLRVVDLLGCMDEPSDCEGLTVCPMATARMTSCSEVVGTEGSYGGGITGPGSSSAST